MQAQLGILDLSTVDFTFRHSSSLWKLVVARVKKFRNAPAEAQSQQQEMVQRLSEMKNMMAMFSKYEATQKAAAA